MKRFLPICIILLITSCSRNLFLPSAVYAPQLRDKHEADIGINGNAMSGVQAQGAFAIGENFGIQTQGNYIGKNGGNVLGGINYWYKIEKDSLSTFLIGFSAGYSGGTYKRYVTRAATNGIPGVESSSGFMLYDIYGRWHGGYFQYSVGVRLDNRFSLYTGTRIQWLNCEKFNYQSQYFARDSSDAITPGQIRTIDPRHGFTTIADVYLGFSFGWEHFHIYLQGQKRYQYNAVNLNDDWRKFGPGVLTAGFSYSFHKRKRSR